MPTPPEIALRLGDGQLTADQLDDICGLYDEVFSQPPFRWTADESTQHRQSLHRLVANPSFGLATAADHDRLAGFAYGITLQQSTSWWTDTIEPLPEDLTAEWPGRTFAVIDLAVHADHRRRGLGRSLLNLLLSSRGEQRATLAVQPVAVETKAFYAHLGWELIGTARAGPGAVSPLFDLYVLPLQPTP